MTGRLMGFCFRVAEGRKDHDFSPGLPAELLKHWFIFAEALEKKMELGNGETIEWTLEFNPASKPGRAHITANLILRNADSKDLCHIHGIDISSHQIEPENIDSYVNLLVSSIEMKRSQRRA